MINEEVADHFSALGYEVSKQGYCIIVDSVRRINYSLFNIGVLPMHSLLDISERG